MGKWINIIMMLMMIPVVYGATEFESTSQAFYWILLGMLWIAFLFVAYFKRGEHGGTIGLFNMVQGLVGFVFGIGMMNFSVLVGIAIIGCSVGAFAVLMLQ